jgi:two-component system LytT family sensor kinase
MSNNTLIIPDTFLSSTNYRKYRIFWHLLFWALYLLLFSVSYTIHYDKLSVLDVMIRFSITLPVDIFASYFTAYYLLPVFLLKGKYLKFILFFLLSAIIFILLQRVCIYYINLPIFYPEIREKISFFNFDYIFSFFNIYAVVGIVTSIRLFKFWFKNQRATQNLREEKLEAELKFLKSQIHPHFLFNTLNNLYALTLDKSDQAPEVVIKLSNLLDYMLYEANDPKVSLEKEIDLIQNFLDLEKIRYRNTLKIDFELSGDPTGYYIAPMLMLPFVENSFKHGLSKQSKAPWMKIVVSLERGLLHFTVKNSQAKQDKEKKESYTEGIGLKNVKRRLDLIYQKNYSLNIKNEADYFEIDLYINLT